jgi:hypothetical protein
MINPNPFKSQTDSPCPLSEGELVWWSESDFMEVFLIQLLKWITEPIPSKGFGRLG